MVMYHLHYYPGNASLAPHLVLEGIGVPFQLVLVDRERNQQKSEAYLRINPMGRIPTLVGDCGAIWESAAICLFLSDFHPESLMIPGPRDPARGIALQWLMFFTNTLQNALMTYHYPNGDDEQALVAERSRAADRVCELWGVVEEHLPPSLLLRQSGGLNTLGAYGLMLAWWSRTLSDRLIPKLPNFNSLIRDASIDPVVQTVFKRENLMLEELCR